MQRSEIKISWVLKKFEELSPYDLYDILKLRQKVFIVEQNCAYADADGKDPESYHLMGWSSGSGSKLVAYSRIVFPGISYEEVSIGRVVSAPEYRRTGIGKLLMEESLKCIEKIYGKVPVRIGAQYYLVNFYKNFEFVPEGEVYFEDGIKHVIMLRKSSGPV